MNWAKRRRREPLERPSTQYFKHVDIGTVVEPDGTGWRWEAAYLYDGRHNPGLYQMSSQHHPRPDTVQGFTRNQATAHARLSEATDLMRQRIVAEQAAANHKEARRRFEVVRP